MTIGDNGEPSRTPACTECLIMVLPCINTSSVLSERTLSVHHFRSPSIYLVFISLTSLCFATLRNAALISIRGIPVMSAFIHVAWDPSTILAAPSMADHPLLLLNCALLYSRLLSASSDNSYATALSTTFLKQLSSEMCGMLLAYCSHPCWVAK